MLQSERSRIGFGFFQAAIDASGTISGESLPVPAATHWVINMLTAFIFLGDAAGQGNTVTAGIFLCPPSMPKNSPATGSFPNGLPLPVDTSSFPFNGNITLGAGPARVTRFTYQGPELIVPSSWFLRLAYPANSGVFNASSNGVCNFSYYIEDDCAS